jgi:hypothetical protein
MSSLSSPAPGAVFLSYAHEDSEPARRIAAALRASGIIVWFDEDELRGGDAWDAKIRAQIASCALFIPIISANTQARLEGYFRIEWKLAAQRTHAMAEAKPFLLPVVIDDTRDADAHVPTEFRAVQWTRLLEKQEITAFTARTKSLLEVDRAVSPSDPPRTLELQRGPIERMSRRDPSRRRQASIVVALLVVSAGAVFWGQKRQPAEPIGVQTPRRESSSPPLSEPRQLVAKAWELLNKPEMARAELDAADTLCKRAIALDSTDADIWATCATVHTWYIFHNFDASPARKEAARDDSSRAMQLNPKSFEARLAQAHYWVRGRSGSEALKRAEAEKLLRGLLVERTEEPRILYALGFLLLLKRETVAGFDLLERAAKDPRFAAVALDEIAYHLWFRGRFAEAEAAVDRSIAAKPYWNNLGLKLRLALQWHGNLNLAAAILEKMPISALQEDSGIRLAAEVYYWRREPLKMLQVLNGQPKDWLRANVFEGPKSFLAAKARLMAKQDDLARAEFRRALDLLERRLAEEPNNPMILGLKIQSLYHLGERTAAEKAYQELQPLLRAYKVSSELHRPIEVIALFNPEAALAYLEAAADDPSWASAATLRLYPEYDRLRGLARFAQVLAKAQEDPARSPEAGAGSLMK